MATSTVLVVDDELAAREFLRHWIEGWGYTVIQAQSATEALRVMLIEPAPIMVCDIKMPGRDGIWLVERVREKWPQTVIIMATAVDDLQTVMKSQRAGAIAYVTKPLGYELLRQALDRAHAIVGRH